MAKRSSASPAPQQGGVVPPDTPSGTRTTRRGSQSRTTPAPSAGRTRGASRQAATPVSELSGPEAARAGLEEMGRDGRAHPAGLGAIEEEGDVTFAPLNDVSPRNGDPAYASQSAPSAYSGFTGKTSFSQDELRSLDPDTILGNLQLLDQTAEDILNYVVPLNLPEDSITEVLDERTTFLLDETSRFRKSLVPRIKSIHELRSGFGGHTYINSELILRRLLDLPGDEPVLSTPWRIDEILYKVNLVTLLEKVFTSKGSEAVFELTQTIDSQFPRIALETLVNEENFRGLAGESKLADSTRELALEIRTQLYIHSLEHDPKTSLNVFHADADEGGYLYSNERGAMNLRLFDLDMAEEDREAFYSNVAERVHTLQDKVAKAVGDFSVCVAELKEIHNWETCCHYILEWLHARHEELNFILTRRGGVAEIVGRLEQKVAEDGARMDPRLRDEVTSGTPRLSSKKNMEAIKRRRERTLGRSQTPSMASQAMQATTFDDFLSQHGASHTDAETAVAVMASLRDGHIEPNRNQFIDPQDGAQRIIFDESQHAYSATPMKRGRPEDSDFSPSQDTGFQSDTRQHAVPTRAPRAIMSAGPAVRNVLPRTSYAADVTSSAQRRPRQNPGQAIDPVPPPTLGPDGTPQLTPFDVYQNAKLTGKAAATHMQKPARARKKFTQQEEEQVLQLISEFGDSYSLMKAADRDQRGDILHDRTAEDIRFKARNIKLDFLKARTALPPGFEYVRLSKKEIDRLEALGIAFEQSSERGTARM